MKTLLGILAMVLLCVLPPTSSAQNTTTLCSPPQVPDCVQPQWGVVQPDDPDGSGMTRPTPLASRSLDRPALVRVAMRASTAGTAPRIVVRDGRTYPSETRALKAALLAAKFDQDGTLVSGADEIRSALEKVEAVSRNHQLVLYLKAAPKLAASDRSLLATKIEQLNALLDRTAAR